MCCQGADGLGVGEGVLLGVIAIFFVGVGVLLGQSTGVFVGVVVGVLDGVAGCDPYGGRDTDRSGVREGVLGGPLGQLLSSATT